MRELLKAPEHEAQPVQVLNFWQVFVLRPTGPCFLPLPGPNFRIFIGMSEHGSHVLQTPEIVTFDAWTLTGKCTSGELYRLGPKAGFTEAMQAWFERRLFLAVAVAADVTIDVLCRIKDARNATMEQRWAMRPGIW
jgi:hypothetical protein